jgi:uncharacterized protein (DUF3084 family)
MMADYGTEQNLRLAQQMLKQQGEINALRAELETARDERDLARKGRQEAHNQLEVAERMRPEDYYQQLEKISGNIADERIAHAAREHELAVLQAAIATVRADCTTMAADQPPADPEHTTWLAGSRAQATRVLNILTATAGGE